MPQEFQSSVRVYKYPFELIMKVRKMFVRPLRKSVSLKNLSWENVTG